MGVSFNDFPLNFIFPADDQPAFIVLHQHFKKKTKTKKTKKINQVLALPLQLLKLEGPKLTCGKRIVEKK